MSRFAYVALSTVVFVVGAGVSAQAFAHAELKSEVPSANASVSPGPANVTLKFSEGIELKFSGVTITGPGNSAVALGDAALGPNDSTTLVVAIKDTLKPGKYEVVWHNLSTDGHKLKGHYTFTVK